MPPPAPSGVQGIQIVRHFSSGMLWDWCEKGSSGCCFPGCGCRLGFSSERKKDQRAFFLFVFWRICKISLLGAFSLFFCFYEKTFRPGENFFERKSSRKSAPLYLVRMRMCVCLPSFRSPRGSTFWISIRHLRPGLSRRQRKKSFRWWMNFPSEGFMKFGPRKSFHRPGKISQLGSASFPQFFVKIFLSCHQSEFYQS